MFLFYCCGDPRALHSFPTRRSSDLAARTRMREMIERLKATSVPGWRDEAAVILDDGAFQRAMRLVPRDEGQALWAEFRSEEHTSELQSPDHLVCRLLLEKKKTENPTPALCVRYAQAVKNRARPPDPQDET